MSLLSRVLTSILVFVIAWLVLWLVSMILLAIPTEPTVWLGTVLDKITVILAALVALLWFFNPRRVI